MDWQRLFNPRSIAVIGASAKDGINLNNFFPSLVYGKFPGKLYPVNHRVSEVLGHTAYKSVIDIPGPVDYALIAVPRERVLDVLKDCIAKEVNAAHIFTAGFGEIHTDAGNKLSDEIKELISGRIRLLGPNCVGIYCPGSHMIYMPQQTLKTGDIGFISQSGGHNSLFIENATSQGLYFSKAISIGNALDLGTNDFLEYLGNDPDTGIIGCYVEGMKEGEGRRFLEQVRNITPKKPVMLMKAGREKAGARTAGSHTGSMAGSYPLWDCMAAQANAVLVEDYTEMADFVWAYKCLDSIQGLRAGVICGGGGNSVWCGDSLASLGLELPPLRPETQKEFLQLTSEVGTIAQNPVDPNFSMIDPEVHYRLFDIMDKQQDIDILINILVFDFTYYMMKVGKYYTKEQVINNLVTRMTTIRERVGKPFISVCIHIGRHSEMTEIMNEVISKTRKKGILCYSSLEQMTSALTRLHTYYRRKDGKPANS